MSSTISDKIKIKPNYTLLTLNAPANYKKGLPGLPAGVKITDIAKNYDQVHWFVMSKSQMEKELSKVMRLLKPDVIVWVFYPKGTSKVQTDLTRDKGWDCLLAEGDKLIWISLISFDDTWSAFGFRAKSDSDIKKEAKPKKEREIFKWVNPQTKEVTLPGDLMDAFKKNQKQAVFFESLSFTNKKEYLEWIVSAKREETRKERILASIDRMAKGWKNPANR